MSRVFQLSKLKPLPRLQKLTPGQKMAADLLWAIHAEKDESAGQTNEHMEETEPGEQRRCLCSDASNPILKRLRSGKKTSTSTKCAECSTNGIPSLRKIWLIFEN